MRTDALSREDWLVGGLALLLAIDLLFLPWFSYSVGIYSASTTRHWLVLTAGPAILAVLASLAVVGDLLVERLSPQTTHAEPRRQPDGHAFPAGGHRGSVRGAQVRAATSTSV